MRPDLIVLASAWLSGLMGAAHCATMCGGIAAGFSATRARASWLDALEPNVGRVLGYGMAGALAGGIGHGLASVLPVESIALLLRSAVGLVLIVAALRLLDRGGRLRFGDIPAQALWRWLAPLRRHGSPQGSGIRRVLAGVLWGWLPCGLSTTILMASWLQGDTVQGAATMIAFGLGTLPTMVPLTWSGARIGLALRDSGLRPVAGLLVLAAGLVTLAAPWLGRLPGVHGVLQALGCRSLA